jgi:hypothetical protein
MFIAKTSQNDRHDHGKQPMDRCAAGLQSKRRTTYSRYFAANRVVARQFPSSRSRQKPPDLSTHLLAAGETDDFLSNPVHLFPNALVGCASF